MRRFEGSRQVEIPALFLITYFYFIPGFLLLNEPIHNDWFNRNTCQVRNHWYWCCHGYHDPYFYPIDGQKWKKIFTPIWAWRDVHFLNIHYNLVPCKGDVHYNKITTIITLLNTLTIQLKSF